jgi:hypothetical protein
VSAVLVAPDSTTLISNAGVCGSTGPQAGPIVLTLPQTGTYSIQLTPAGLNTGGLTVNLFGAAPVTASTSIGGTPANISTSVPGQTADVTFSGTSGTLVSIYLTNSTYPGCAGIEVNLIAPDSTPVVSNDGVCGSSGPQSGPIVQTLAQTGTYTIQLLPQYFGTGSVTVAVYNAAPATATIVPNGPPIVVGATAPGQVAQVTFTGVAGALATLAAWNSTYPSCAAAYFDLYNPSGTDISHSGICGSSATPVSYMALPASGTYTFVITPLSGSTGSMTLQLWTANPDTLSVRGKFSNGGISGTSITLNLPSAIQLGDLSVIGLSSLSYTAVFTPPAGWTPLLNATGVGVFYRIYQSGDPVSNVAFTSSQSNWMSATGITYIGADQTNPIDAFNYWIFRSVNSGPNVPAYSRAPTLNPNYNGSQLLSGFFAESYYGSVLNAPANVIAKVAQSPGPNILFADAGLIDGTPTGNLDATGGVPFGAGVRAGFQLAIKAAGSSAATAQPAPPSVGGELAIGWLTVGSSANFTFDFGSIGVQNNDLLIVTIVPSSGGVAPSSVPSGFSPIDSATGGAGTYSYLWQTGDPTTFTFGWTNASRWVTPHAWIIRGSGTGNAPQIDQHNVNYIAAGTSVAAPGLTPTSNTDLLVLMYGNDYGESGSWTLPVGPTFDVNYTLGPELVAGSLPLTGEGVTSQYSAGISVSGQMWAFAIAVEMPAQ